MRKIFIIFLLLAPFIGKSQCTEAPQFQSVIVEINDICSFTDDPYNWLMPDSTNGEPIDSIGVTMYHYPTAERDSLVLSKSTVYTNAYVDWSGMQLGYGLVAEVFAVNSCGVSDTVSTPIDILVGFEAESCATSYGTQILGNTQIDFNDSSAQTYIIDSPELRTFVANNSLDNFYTVFTRWELQQFEGGGYQTTLWDTVINDGVISDTVVVLDEIPDGKFYLIAELDFICNCTSGENGSKVVLDTLIIEKTDLQGAGAWISGQALINENGNCAGAASPISGQVVQIQPGNKYATADNNGWFGVNVEPGTYTLSLLGSNGQSCDTSGVAVTVAQGDTSTITLKAKVDYTDVALNSWGRALMQRDSYTQWISIKNAGRALQGDVHCEVLENNGAQAVNLDDSSPSANSLTATTATWDDVSLGFNEEASFYIEGALENVVMNDSITAVVSYITTDSTFVDTLKVLVRNSYDPNDKWVDVEEVLIADYEAEIPTLNYRIRFQNTGNDTAYTIVVRDTVRENLDISTLTLGASSHDYTFAILDGNVLEWTFEDILLPDSTTDEPGSNGFIFFDMKPKAGLAVGDVVANNADIYFDLNPPIITNFATTEITEPCDLPEIKNVRFNGLQQPDWCDSNLDRNIRVSWFRVQGAPYDSCEIVYSVYIDSAKTQLEEVDRFKTDGTLVDKEFSSIGFGLIVAVTPINDCGMGLTDTLEMRVVESIQRESCDSTYQTQIIGQDSIDLIDNDPKTYVLDSPELRAYVNKNALDTGWGRWELKQKDGSGYYESEFFAFGTQTPVDTLVTFDSIPPGRFVLSFRFSPVCVCGSFEANSFARSHVIDSLDIYKIDLGGNDGWVQGNLYVTETGDCGDTSTTISKQLVRVSPGNFYGVTKPDGSFSMSLEPGEYTAELSSYFGEPCEPGGVPFTVTTGDATDISLSQEVAFSDLSISGWGRALLQRNSFACNVVFKNMGRQLVGDLTVSVLGPNPEDRVTFDFTNPEADPLNVTEAQWKDRVLPFNQEARFAIRGTLGNVSMGDSITVEAIFRGDGGNIFVKNISMPVTNSYDPNDKSVNINGIMIEDLLQEVPFLDYRIRFQNTGNDTAFTVVVTDTLPEYLDPSTLLMGASSHEYAFNLSDAGVMTWTFENINLPDSGTNMLESQGYVLFQMKPFQDLEVGTLIRNRANIFFDLNPPIITNDAVTQITTMASIQQHGLASYQLYPNPVTHRLHIQGDQQIHELQLIDLQGAVLYRAEVQGKEAAMDMSAWLPGVYFIRIVNKQGLSTTHKVVKR